MIVTRFAPSPTGQLHLGHAASALFTFNLAQKDGGKFLLRIEDIDPVRCRDVYSDDILEDLHWLGLSWQAPVRKQSQHMKDYANALDQLRERRLIYPCFCTRREVLEEAKAAGHAPHEGEEGPVYSGTCRHLTEEQRDEKSKSRQAVWRLDMKKALALTGSLSWHDSARGAIEVCPERFGDVVLARRDVAASYHLCVTLDDASQGITLVTRGEDLMASTDIHVVLQKLLGLPTPTYHHHPLLLDVQGKRFAKRDKAVTIRALRGAGMTPEEVRQKAIFS
ncbi:MAG TPA: tRNA glutamyl-Q(34) synthetase GluQRS [Rhodospirillaceae bacterium]|nr:tRNA glutamyl-Q(34) synthetase GluQRS [Rhodospirillaceae bacterium]